MLGILTIRDPTQTTDPPLMSWASYNTNNQLAATNQAPGGVPYDESGNVLNDGLNRYLYDAEGRICAVASTPVAGLTAMTGYIYDAGGTRVAKGSITTWSCDPTISGFATTNDYIIGPSNEQMTEMGMGGVTNGTTTTGLTWQHTNVWAGAKLLATYDNDGLHFYLDDPLGTRRVQTDYEGVVERTCVSLPYGDGETCGTTPTEHLFTGKERDIESGNDYFEARYYSSAMGRFMSPDWAAKEDPVPYATFDDPQSLNLYSYVRNNPLSKADKDGHCAEDACILEGGAAAGTGLYLLGAAAIAGGAAVLNSPAGQRSFDTFTSAAGANLSSNYQAVKGAVTGFFSKKAPDPGKPGTKGKPDHQATAAEEAKKIGGETEVRIPTPGGAKETRVGDAVATDASGKPTAVTQVIRPTPAGNVPLREQKAAQDIENATGVKPKLVPVRPLPQQ